MSEFYTSWFKEVSDKRQAKVDVALITKDIEDGISIDELIHSHGISKITAQRYIRKIKDQMKPLKHGRQSKFTLDQETEILKLYRSGISVEDLCIKFNSHRSSVYRLLQRPENKKQLTMCEKMEIFDSYGKGESIEKLSKSFNTKKSYIIDILREMKI